MTRNRAVLALARPYVRSRLRRAFDGVHVEGLARVRRVMEMGPVIIAANHCCWWDAFTILELDRALFGEGRCLMDADNLARLPFFKWVGALPLDRTSPRQTVRDLTAAMHVLEGPGSALWIFPQGEQRPAHVRPLGLNRGVAWLARKARVPVVPLAISYLFREAPEPAIAAAFGSPIVAVEDRANAVVEQLERELAAGLDRCDRFIMSGEGTFLQLVAPRRMRRVPFAGRLLAAAVGGERA